VYRIANYRLWERFLERKWEMEKDLNRTIKLNRDCERMFHGTTQAEAITKTGFKVELCKLQGMMGQGKNIQ
jgi:hypothetical protein